MAKTIKEKSTDFVLSYISGGTKQSWLKDGYIAGANAVLTELEKAIKECDIDVSPYVAMLDRIKQLKGE